MIDLTKLAAPEVIKEIDYEESLANLVARHKENTTAAGLTWDAELDSDPVMIQLQVVAFQIVLLIGYINEAARNQILYFALGAGLEHLGSFYNVARMAGEDDERMRARVQLATIGGSVGGTHERLKAVAMASDIRVRNIATWTEGRDPTVNIAVLSTDIGGAADQALLDTVTDAINAPDVKLVSDRYEIMSAVRIVADVQLRIRLAPDASASILADLPQILAEARDAEDLLGLDLTRAWLAKNAMVEGVTNVEVIAPAADIEAAPNEAIGFGTIAIVDGGRGR